MDLLNTESIKALGISSNQSGDATHKLYTKMVQWGWIDGLGRSRGWEYWNRKP